MGFESINITINNNRKLLKNRKRIPFTKTNGGSSKKTGYKPYVLPKLPPHVLKRIRSVSYTHLTLPTIYSV